MRLTRRIAVPHVTTLDCECGGDYRVIENQRLHFQDRTDPEQPVYFAHRCTNCGKEIWIKNMTYPQQSMLMDNEGKEDIGEMNEIYDKDFLDDIKKKNNATPPTSPFLS